MNRWPDVSLGNLLIEAAYGTSVKCSERNEGVPVLRMGNVRYDGGLDLSGLKYADLTPLDMGKFGLKVGDILFNRTNSKELVGKTALWDGQFPAAAASYFIRLRVKKNIVEPAWVWLFLNSPRMKRRLFETARGAIGQANINSEELKAFLVPLPPLDEQRRFVSLLDRAADVRRRADAARAKARAIIPALFLDMFGDPATNPKGWEEKRLGDLAAKMSDGPFGSNLKSEHYCNRGVRVWRLQNIGVGQVRDDDKAYISEEHFCKIRRHECLPGDVIIGTLGDPNLRSIVQPDWINRAINKADCVQFRPNNLKVKAEYISELMNQKGMLARCSGQIAGQTRSRISMGRLREVFVPLPPLPLQTAFAEQARRIDAIACALDAAAGKAEAMAAALSNDIFG